LTCCLWIQAFATPYVVRADYKADVGYTQLTNELGGALPTGAGISVTHVEALQSGNYMPDEFHAEFLGKTFDNVSGSSTGVSSHATTVGRYFYGTDTSMAPDIGVIDNFESGNWLGTGFLRAGLFLEPKTDTNRIQNHSWIGSAGDPSDAIRRLDYAIERDGFTAVVAVNNGSATAIPQLLAHSYNAIVVGRTDGNHSSGNTTFDEAGRMKPDIVAPYGAVSYSTPMISAAAALLAETIDNDSSLTNANSPQCIKALLLAGATKDEFPSWSRTPAHPLDNHYGVGELNIYNSYQTLASGESFPSNTGTVSGIGWNSKSVSGVTNAHYFFEVPASNVMTRLSVILAWNREITDGGGGGFDPQAFVADFDLHLHEASNFTSYALLETSTSNVDNVEHVYRRNLLAGQYAIEVEAHDAGEYALAWFSRSALIPEISTISTSNGNIHLSASATPGVPYGIQASTNLLDPASWVMISTNTSATNVLLYEDSESGGLPVRFYRLVPDP